MAPRGLKYARRRGGGHTEQHVKIRLTMDVTDLQRYQLAVWLDGEPTKRLATREEIRDQIDSIIMAFWDNVRRDRGD